MVRSAMVSSLLLIACSKEPAPLVHGGGIAITSADLVARLADQPPSVRFHFQNPEGRKQFLEDSIRFELLAKAAQADGLLADPEVQFALKRALLDKYHQRFMDGHPGAASVTDEELTAYFDAHQEDYSRPARVRAAIVVLSAAADSPERAKKAAQAARLLEKVNAGDPKVFADVALADSDDAATRPLGGDLGLRTREELTRYDGTLAERALATEVDQPAQLVETPGGFYLLRVLERQPEQHRTLDSARAQIASVLAAQHADEDYQALVERLRRDANVTIDEAQLDALKVPLVPGGRQ